MKNNWQFMYSYDFTVSGLIGDSGGTSEISLSFFLKKVDETNIAFLQSLSGRIWSIVIGLQL